MAFEVSQRLPGKPSKHRVSGDGGVRRAGVEILEGVPLCPSVAPTAPGTGPVGEVVLFSYGNESAGGEYPLSPRAGLPKLHSP